LNFEVNASDAECEVLVSLDTGDFHVANGLVHLKIAALGNVNRDVKVVRGAFNLHLRFGVADAHVASGFAGISAIDFHADFVFLGAYQVVSAG
jgi:hypothetical protein